MLDRQEEREGGIRLVAVVGRVGYLPGRYQQSRTQGARFAGAGRRKPLLLRVQGRQNCTHATCFGGLFERK